MMKKLSKINESFIDDVIARARDKSVVRMEEILKTCIGIDLILENPNIDYDFCLNKLLNKKYNMNDYLLIDTLNNYSSDEIKNILNDKEKYKYLISDKKNKNSLVADFDIDLFTNHLPAEITQNITSDKDYISLFKCATEKLKEVKNDLKFVTQKDTAIHWCDKTNKVYENNDTDLYIGDYVLCLIDEDTVNNYNYCYTYDDKILILNKFIINMSNMFINTLKYKENFITWSYKNDFNIGIPVSVNNLNNFYKYKKYAKELFNDEKIK